jgi:uncharacterized protein (TIGR03435 family)
MIRRVELGRKLRAGWASGLVAVAAMLLGLGGARLGAQTGQDIAGTWQGALEGSGARVMLKVAKGDAGGWKGVVYGLDQEDRGRTASSLTAQNGTVTFAIASVEVSFEGKLSLDGASIDGKLQQGGKVYGLKLVRATSDTEWAIEKAKVMAKDADPSFEVATVKPSDPKNGSKGFHSGNGRRINCDNETAADIVEFVYGMHAKQIVGAPQWFFDERWDVDGYPDVPGGPYYKQMQGMYRKLLEERFGLKMHRETRTMGAYVLTVAKGVPKLSKSVDQEAMSDTTFTQWNSQRRVLRVTSTTMAEFVMTMDSQLDKPLVDQTGLMGKWDFLLKWRPDTAPDTDDPNALPGLFTAIQEQIGLKLEAVKAPVDVIVIDHVERPSAN